jgi:hypothetical protein
MLVHLMKKQWRRIESNPLHVSLVAVPDAVASTLFGIFDVMNAFTDGSVECAVRQCPAV